MLEKETNFMRWGRGGPVARISLERNWKSLRIIKGKTRELSTAVRHEPELPGREATYCRFHHRARKRKVYLSGALFSRSNVGQTKRKGKKNVSHSKKGQKPCSENPQLARKCDGVEKKEEKRNVRLEQSRFEGETWFGPLGSDKGKRGRGWSES